MITLSDGAQVFFSPQDDTVAEFEALLNSATATIHLADYTFNIPEVARVLIAKSQAGLDVRLILDHVEAKTPSEVPEVKLLQNAGVPTEIVESSKHKIMHNKFTVIDGHICQAGSWNYTASAADENNFYFVFDSPEIAQVFEADFEGMWSGETTVIESTITKGETQNAK